MSESEFFFKIFYRMVNSYQSWSRLISDHLPGSLTTQVAVYAFSFLSRFVFITISSLTLGWLKISVVRMLASGLRHTAYILTCRDWTLFIGPGHEADILHINGW